MLVHCKLFFHTILSTYTWIWGSLIRPAVCGSCVVGIPSSLGLVTSNSVVILAELLTCDFRLASLSKSSCLAHVWPGGSEGWLPCDKPWKLRYLSAYSRMWRLWENGHGIRKVSGVESELITKHGNAERNIFPTPSAEAPATSWYKTSLFSGICICITSSVSLLL
jgi:hypothetical protein